MPCSPESNSMVLAACFPGKRHIKDTLLMKRFGRNLKIYGAITERMRIITFLVAIIIMVRAEYKAILLFNIFILFEDYKRV